MYKINFAVIYSIDFDKTIIKYNNKKYDIDKNIISLKKLIKSDKEFKGHIKSYLRFNKNKKLNDLYDQSK